MTNNSYLTDPFFSVLDDTTRLEKIVSEQPWCTVAQLFLLHNYKKNNSEYFEKQAAKTILFFKDEIWLNWQLHLLDANPLSVEAVEKALTKSEVKKEEPSEDIIAFEPFHTVDYFASQGIKITEQPGSNDRLGVQMKSFTEWLKSMKKINATQLPGGDEQTDKKIQQIAEDSNVAGEVVTEAMAEVLAKQGKSDKAIEVYEKLTLLNPSKSVYFAAQISILKTS